MYLSISLSLYIYIYICVRICIYIGGPRRRAAGDQGEARVPHGGVPDHQASGREGPGHRRGRRPAEPGAEAVGDHVREDAEGGQSS